MFDENYFRTSLQRDVEAMGGRPVVEIQLLSGHAHRVRSVVEINAGSVTLETYLSKGDLALSIHGLSFAKPHAPESLLEKYLGPTPDAVNESWGRSH